MSHTLGYTATPTAGTFSIAGSTQCAAGDTVNFPAGTISVYKLWAHFKCYDSANHPAWACLWTGGGTLLLAVSLGTIGAAQQWYGAAISPSALSGYGQVTPGFAVGSVGYTTEYDNTGTSQKSGNGNSPPGAATWGSSGFGYIGAYVEYNTAPTISSFSPTNGGPGTSVVITGTEFNSTTGVDFNGTAASFTINSDTQVTATVPAGATTGPIHLTSPAGSATSATNYIVASMWALRSGTWREGDVDVLRTGSQVSAQQVAVLRTGVWTPGA